MGASLLPRAQMATGTQSQLSFEAAESNRLSSRRHSNSRHSPRKLPLSQSAPEYSPYSSQRSEHYIFAAASLKAPSSYSNSRLIVGKITLSQRNSSEPRFLRWPSVVYLPSTSSSGTQKQPRDAHFHPHPAMAHIWHRAWCAISIIPEFQSLHQKPSPPTPDKRAGGPRLSSQARGVQIISCNLERHEMGSNPIVNGHASARPEQIRKWFKPRPLDRERGFSSPVQRSTGGHTISPSQAKPKQGFRTRPCNGNGPKRPTAF